MKSCLVLIAMLIGSFKYDLVYAEVWQVAGDETFPPYVYAQNDRVVGIHADIVRAVLDKLQVDYELKTYPWKRVINMTDKAMVTFSMSWVESVERFEKYLMVGPIQYGRTVFMVRKDSIIEFSELSDLKGYKIGMISGYTYPMEFKAAAFLNKEAATVDNAQLISKLLAKRVDVIIGDESTLSFEAKKLHMSHEIKILPKPLKVVSRYVAFPKAFAKQAALFSNGLTEFKNEKEYQEIIDRYR
ncbi:MAG: transporter substrate-binding domain-containing protein [Bermanella sp.]